MFRLQIRGLTCAHWHQLVSFRWLPKCINRRHSFQRQFRQKSKYWLTISWGSMSKSKAQFINRLRSFSTKIYFPFPIPPSLDCILITGKGEISDFLIWQNSYLDTVLGPIRWPIRTLTNLGPLFTLWVPFPLSKLHSE